MYEKECDEVLKIIHDWNSLIPIEKKEIIKRYPDKDYRVLGCIDTVLAILVSDNFVEKRMFSYSITDTGKAFFNTSSYMNENKSKDKEREKLDLDIKMTKWLLKTKWLPHIIATASFILSVMALIMSIKE